MDNRIINLALMKKGYGVHPERDVVLVTENVVAKEEYKKKLSALALRYIEADFLVLLGNSSSDYSFVENIYPLADLSEEELNFLRSLAKLECDDSIPLDEFDDVVGQALEKEGYNRKNTTLLAVDEDDTTRKIIPDCDKSY